jgi:uncharacterized protein (DUF1800 family)
MKNPIPGAQPYGRHDWEFDFRPDLHDFGEKQFLGQRGNFDGGDIVDIIVRQPAAARFIARRLHNFFVSDEPDGAAIEDLANVYIESQYDIRAVMGLPYRTLSDRRGPTTRGQEPGRARHRPHAAGRRLPVPGLGIRDIALECRYMGQDLLNPPSVEGWHTGKEWIDTGILVERINFAAGQVGDATKPGVRKIIERLRGMGELTPEQFVDACLDLMGPMDVSDTTRDALLTAARKGGNLRFTGPGDSAAEQRVTEMLQLIVATREFQLV